MRPIRSFDLSLKENDKIGSNDVDEKNFDC